MTMTRKALRETVLRKTVLLCAALLAFLAPTAWGQEDAELLVDRELWYRVEIQGAPAGWMMTREGRRGEHLVTESRTHLEFTRSTAVVAVDMESRFVESRDGRPIEAWSRKVLGSQPLVTSYAFQPDAVVVVTEHRGESRRQEVAWPEGDWFTPAALERYLEERMEEGAEDLLVRAIDPLLGVEPVATRWTLEARGEVVETGQGKIATNRWRQVPDYAPQIVTTAFVDAEGRLIKSVTPLMGLEMTTVLASREEAMGTESAAPELLVRSFVETKKIERPRRVRRAVYEIVIDGDSPPELPEIGAQHVEVKDGRILLTVEVGSSPKLRDVDPEAYLAASTYISHDDPNVRRLLSQALAKESDAASLSERAETLRAFVNRYLVEKDLNTLLATAAEVAETRSGDCTEHAVLLTALLRAAGIPARVVTGLVYAERFAGASQIFGYHMWSQALIDGRWIDLDATLDGSRFDATHIAFATSALDDERTATRDIARIGAIMGHLKIKVLEVGY